MPTVRELDKALGTIQPARIDQIQCGPEGMAIIDADVGGIAEELRRIDPGLKVRFAPNDPSSGKDPCWVVYHETENPDGSITHHLVTTAQAWQNRSGTWEGLDARIVERIRFIDRDGRSGYDYAKALEDNRKERLKRERDARLEHSGQVAEQMAYALRKDLGLGPYKSRIFKPNDRV